MSDDDDQASLVDDVDSDSASTLPQLPACTSEGFLETLVDNSPHTLRIRALEHYGQAKKIWGNHRFMGVLLECNLPCSMRRYNLVASRKSAEFLMRKIRSDTFFGDVYKYKEPDSMMRSALSIWIGYWSNEFMTLLLVDSMGRRALGLNYCVDDSLEDMSVEEDMMVCSSIIADLRQDESIKALAEQLLKNPEAVKMAEELLMSLQEDVPDGRADRYVYHVRHKNVVFRFWNDPIIVVQLRKALKESIHLVNILMKYSKGAQLLRCAERVSRIQRDPLLNPILESDRVHKTKGALSILFGYWGEIDLTMLLCTIFGAQEKNEALFEFDAKDDKFEVLNYLFVGPGDVEGLKNVLSDKYSEESVEYRDRFLKIRGNQEREESNQQWEESVEANIRFVTVLLKNGDVIYFNMDT